MVSDSDPAAPESPPEAFAGADGAIDYYLAKLEQDPPLDVPRRRLYLRADRVTSTAVAVLIGLLGAFGLLTFALRELPRFGATPPDRAMSPVPNQMAPLSQSYREPVVDRPVAASPPPFRPLDASAHKMATAAIQAQMRAARRSLRELELSRSVAGVAARTDTPPLRRVTPAKAVISDTDDPVALHAAGPAVPLHGEALQRALAADRRLTRAANKAANAAALTPAS